MTREVYSDKDFIEFSRSQIFVRIFIDEDPEGKELAREFAVEALPTLIILDSKGREVDRIVGGRDAPDLIRMLKFLFENSEDDSISI
jgi:thioredoxin-related protein